MAKDTAKKKAKKPLKQRATETAKGLAGVGAAYGAYKGTDALSDAMNELAMGGAKVSPREYRKILKDLAPEAKVYAGSKLTPFGKLTRGVGLNPTAGAENYAFNPYAGTNIADMLKLQVVKPKQGIHSPVKFVPPKFEPGINLPPSGIPGKSRWASPALVAHEGGHAALWDKGNVGKAAYGIGELSKQVTPAAALLGGGWAALQKDPTWAPTIATGAVMAPGLASEIAASALGTGALIGQYGVGEGLQKSLPMLPALASYAAPILAPAAITGGRKLYRKARGIEDDVGEEKEASVAAHVAIHKTRDYAAEKYRYYKNPYYRKGQKQAAEEFNMPSFDRMKRTGLVVGGLGGGLLGARMGGVASNLAGVTDPKWQAASLAGGALAGMGFGGWLGQSSLHHLAEDIYRDMHPEQFGPETMDEYVIRHLELDKVGLGKRKPAFENPELQQLKVAEAQDIGKEIYEEAMAGVAKDMADWVNKHPGVMDPKRDKYYNKYFKKRDRLQAKVDKHEAKHQRRSSKWASEGWAGVKTAAEGFTPEQRRTGWLAAVPAAGQVMGPAYAAQQARHGEEIATGLATYGAGEIGRYMGFLGGGLAGTGIGAGIGHLAGNTGLGAGIGGATGALIGMPIGRGLGAMRGLRSAQMAPGIRDTANEEGGASEGAVAAASLLPLGAPVAAGIGAPPGSKNYRALTTLGGTALGASVAMVPGLMLEGSRFSGPAFGFSLPWKSKPHEVNLGTILALLGFAAGGAAGAAASHRIAKHTQEVRAGKRNKRRPTITPDLEEKVAACGWAAPIIEVLQ